MFVSVAKIIESLSVAIAFSVLLCGCCYKLTGILQSCGYSGKRLVHWANKKNNLIITRHILLAIMCALGSAVIGLCFSFTGDWAAVCSLASYIIFLIVYIWADNRVALRTPAVPTPRFKRLYALLFVLTAIIAYFAITLLNYADFSYAQNYAGYWGAHIFNILRYVPLSLFALLLIPLVLLANALSKIYEIPHNKSFVKKAREKLAAADIKVIAITGSYGKTSTKQILSEILKSKYRVLATPRSHNTPMGLALSVNGNNLADYDVFIAEMGACNLGDIAELCEICPPDYSLITGICPQHLESFGSVENIIKAKGEILSFTKSEAVIAESCFDMFAEFSCKKECGGSVKDVICSPEGSIFTIALGDKDVRLKTKLLGRHNAENISLAAQVAYKMGMTAEEISKAVANIEFIEHRLQLIKSGEVNILDDGYNSNVKGAAAALEVLKSFDGRKIVVTPGLVELGVLEESENRQLGENLVGFDYVILVGETLVLPVKEGYLQSGGDREKLIIKPSLQAAQEELKSCLQSGDTVLFLNDLPDIY